jgi:hypothetical protein
MGEIGSEISLFRLNPLSFYSNHFVAKQTQKTSNRVRLDDTTWRGLETIVRIHISQERTSNQLIILLMSSEVDLETKKLPLREGKFCFIGVVRILGDVGISYLTCSSKLVLLGRIS